jgi:type I restriction enzyme S subunit
MYKFEDLIEEVKEFNTDLRYGLDDIVGVTIEKGLIPTIANLTQTALDKFYIIKPETFVYNPRTHGVRLGMGYNDTCNTYITTWNNVAFRVKDTAKNIVIPQYLWLYFCRPVWDRLTNFLAWGSSTIVFAWKDFLTIEIDLPSITRQREIVAEYETLTRRIRINEQMIQNLESTAQTLYRKMFVDGIDKENLPEGWKMGTLGEVAKIVTGKLNSEDAVENGIYPFFTCSQETYRTDSYAFDQEAVLLAGNNASAIYPLKIYKGKFNAYQRTYVISSLHKTVNNKQLYYAIKDKLEDFKGSSQGTTTKFLTIKILNDIPIIIPNIESFIDFSSQMNILYNNLSVFKEENLKLTELQSLLLAKMGQ